MMTLKDFGFVEGNYESTCLICGLPFHGVKYCLHCQDCAQNLLDAHIETENIKGLEDMAKGKCSKCGQLKQLAQIWSNEQKQVTLICIDCSFDDHGKEVDTPKYEV